jgi:hypothetical protein
LGRARAFPGGRRLETRTAPAFPRALSPSIAQVPSDHRTWRASTPAPWRRPFARPPRRGSSTPPWSSSAAFAVYATKAGLPTGRREKPLGPLGAAAVSAGGKEVYQRLNEGLGGDLWERARAASVSEEEVAPPARGRLST